MKKKIMYIIEGFDWILRKDNTGFDKCFKEEKYCKTLIVALFYIIKYKSKCDGVVFTHCDR